MTLTAEGLVGVGPRNVELGDKIYILDGAKRPFVLRPQKRGLALVRECYLRPMMDWQIAGPVKNGIMMEEPVELVWYFRYLGMLFVYISPSF